MHHAIQPHSKALKKSLVKGLFFLLAIKVGKRERLGRIGTSWEELGVRKSWERQVKFGKNW